MSEKFTCLYCSKPSDITEENGKFFLDCKQCGKRELTKLGLERLRARKIK